MQPHTIRAVGGDEFMPFTIHPHAVVGHHAVEVKDHQLDCLRQQPAAGRRPPRPRRPPPPRPHPPRRGEIPPPPPPPPPWWCGQRRCRSKGPPVGFGGTPPGSR